MKKIFLLSIVSLVSIILIACNNESSSEESQSDKTLSIFTTVYPLQYFAQQIGGDFVNVQSIYPPGSNEHTFEPTQKDMIKLADADLFFYIGLGLEGFVENAKTTLNNENVKVIATADNISEEDLYISTGHTHAEVISENEGDGHNHEHVNESHDELNHEHVNESDDEHNHEHVNESDDKHNHGELDSHVWLSPIISQQLASIIKDELVAAMPEQKQIFEQNYKNLVAQLKALDSEFKEMANNVNSKTFFISHAAFGYIAGHYGLQQIPVAGLNSQSEPSQKELTAIVELAKKENIQYIFFEQNVSSKLTKVIQEEIGADTLILHNLSVLTDEDIKNGENYFTLMRSNMENLQKALKQ